MTPSTHFAPAVRALPEELSSHNLLLREHEMVQSILNAIPNVVLVLNPERQIVFCNYKLLEVLGIASELPVVGQRPGELLKCIHADESEGGCGTTEFCEFCGAVIAILNSQHGETDTRECRISVRKGASIEALDLRVTATPLTIEGLLFTFFTIIDISDEKRRKVLERVFFHDVLNTASVIKNSAEILATETDPGQVEEFSQLLPEVADRLIGEIQAQRQLIRAENGELSVEITDLQSGAIIRQAVTQARGADVARSVYIEIEPDSEEIAFVSDPVILFRVLGNMLKNALEASKRYAFVHIASLRLDERRLRFIVRNEGVIHRNVQLQLFQRSFSTKGASRGIGTYSIKLLTEKYLKGSVGFSSTEETGTEFHVDLPIIPE